MYKWVIRTRTNATQIYSFSLVFQTTENISIIVKCYICKLSGTLNKKIPFIGTYSVIYTKPANEKQKHKQTLVTQLNFIK